MSKKTKKFQQQKHLLFTAVVMLGVLAAHMILTFPQSSTQIAEAAIKLRSTTDIVASTSAVWFGKDIAIDAQGNSVVVLDKNGIPGDGTGRGIGYRRYSQDETALDATEVRVNTTTNGQEVEPAVVMDEDGNFIVVWEGNGSGNYEIYMQAFLADGTTVGTETVVNTTSTGDQTDAQIAIDSDGPTSATRFVVIWTDNSSGNIDTKYRRFDIDFDAPSAASAVDITEQTANSHTTNNQDANSVAMNNLGEFTITWFGEGPGGTNGAWYRVFAQDGTALATEALFENFAGAAINSSIAADKMPRSSLDDANARRFIIAHEETIDSSDIEVRRITCTDPNTSNNDDTDLNCLLDPVEIIANTDTTGVQILPEVDADYLGNFTVTWQDSGIDGNGNGIGAQSYTYLGKRIGQNFIVNNTTSGNQEAPKIAMNNDGFYNIIFREATTSQFQFQNYVNETFKVQTEVLPYASSTGTETDVETDIAPNGNHVEVWKSDDGNIYFTLREFDNDASIIADTVAVDDNPGGDIGCHDGRTTNYVCDNPDISFFKDSTGAALGKFIIVWERDDTLANAKEIMYRIYDAAGNPEGSATVVNTASTGNQTRPAVSAGIYDSGGGADEQKFSVGWVDENTNNIETAFNDDGFTYATLYTTCSTCQGVRVDHNENNDRAAFVWRSGNAVFTAKTIAGAADGGTTNIDNLVDAIKSTPDVAFFSNDRYFIVYSFNAHVASGNIAAKTVNFNAGSNPQEEGSFNLYSQYSHTDGAQSNPKVVGDKTNEDLLVVWTDFPTTAAENHIFGQYFDVISNVPTQFGPTFRINSTQENSQSLPAVAMNEAGETVVAWEGNVDQPSNVDTAGLATQLLQNPLNIQEVDPLTPTAQQEITAGARFLNVPDNITFQTINLSTTDNQTQSVSVRSNSADNGCGIGPCGSDVCISSNPCVGDSCSGSGDSVCICDGVSCGGDTLKYIEIEGAAGVQNFTLSVQASDFISVQDGFPYIKNDQHFYVKNWDNNNFETGTCDDPACGTITAGNCLGDPDECFLTVQTSEATTGFTLDAETSDFTLIDTQKPLATKDDGGNEEVGKWRIYPEFMIIVPKIVPPGNHNATITFTLT